MTPPQVPGKGSNAGGNAPAAVSLRLTVLRKRADFLRAARAARVVKPGFILQMRKRAEDEASGVRVGFTCSKKVGNAVARNRAKRRLREIARLELQQTGCSNCDYVLVGRAETTAALPFDSLRTDLREALKKLHGGGA